LTGLADRIGLAVIRPAEAMRQADAHPGRGARDALVLLALALVCVELRGLVASAWAFMVQGFGAGLAQLVRALEAAVSTDLVLIVCGGVVIALAAGRSRDWSRDFDLACVAWIPALMVRLLVATVLAWSGVEAPRWVGQGASVAAIAAMAVGVLVAIRVARAREATP